LGCVEPRIAPTTGFENPGDRYYHAGTARLYAEQGWPSSLPWLEHTALGADSPGFFDINTHNHYPVGLDTEFLRRTVPRRFDAFRRLYEGNAERPEQLPPA
jgi:hypothetical protein